jgi:hypothetical protein
VIYRAVLGFLAVKLATLVANLAWFPVLGKRRPADRQPPAANLPSALGPVSLLIPMRNEADRFARFLPAALAQSGIAEVVVLDDGSTDGTAALVETMLAGVPHARLVHGSACPPGWVGKSWACQQLAGHATGQLLVFCDADVLLAPGAVTAVLAEMARQRADLFSVFPRQLTGGLGEALLTPLIDDVLLCFLPFGLLSVDVPAAATANGSLLALHRQTFTALDGFASVRSELVEDVALARTARRAGCKLGLALGGDLVQTRMYAGYRQAVLGLGRGLLPVTGGARWRLVAAAGWHLAVYTWPWAAAVRRRRWLLPLGLGLAERLLVALKCHPRAAWQALLTPLCPVAFVPVVGQALSRRQQWKGRSYS